MRDLYCWLSVLLSFVLLGQPFAMGHQKAGPCAATVGSVSFDLYRGCPIVARGSAGPLMGLAFLLDTGASSLILFARTTRLHSLKLDKPEFGQEPAFVVPKGIHAGQAFDGLTSPAAPGLTRVVIDVGRGKLAFSR